MKRSMIFRLIFPILIILLASIDSTDAALIEFSDEVTFDDTNNLYWARDVGMFTGSFTDKMNLINDLETMGGTWRLATLEDMNLLWEYDADEIFGSFDYNFSANNALFWCLGIYDEVGPPAPDGTTTHNTAAVEWQRATTDMYTKLTIPHSAIRDDGSGIVFTDGAWVVSTTAPAPIPEPCTLLLLGSGLLGLVGFRRKFKS